MKRNDHDLYRRMSLSLMSVAMALAFQAMRPAFADPHGRVLPDGPPPGSRTHGGQQGKPTPPALIIGPRIRYIPDTGLTNTLAPPLPGSAGGDVIDCIAGCYASPKVAALAPSRPRATPENDELPDARQAARLPEPQLPAAASASQAQTKSAPAAARKPRVKQATARHGGSGDWFRRINHGREGER